MRGFTLIELVTSILILAIIVGLWVIYRIARGWIALINSEPMPVPD